MKSLESYFENGVTHHAYIIETNDVISVVESLASFLKTHNPLAEIISETYDAFSIDHARTLKQKEREAAGTKKYFIISVASFGREALQALLKTLEEPGEESHFFFILPPGTDILPTVWSRVVKISLDHANPFFKEARRVITLSLSERLAYVASFIERYEDNDDSARFRSDAGLFIGACVEQLHKNTDKDQTLYSLLEKLETLRSYTHIRGSLIKMILEDTMLLIPIHA